MTSNSRRHLWDAIHSLPRKSSLSAVLSTHSDGALHDDPYDYESVADPFFADLGEAVARELWGAEAGNSANSE